MKIAVVGTGISGLVAAYLLADDHELTLFEAAERVGGHTHTVIVRDPRGETPVDTGFIVFNEAAYPNFCKLLTRLGVASQPSDMSFSVQCLRTGLEYAGTNLNTLFAQRQNLLRPAFVRMVLDILRFNLQARLALGALPADATLAGFLRDHGYSRRFIEHYIVPMGAAIWSADPQQFDRIPLRFFVQFFENHGMLAGFARPAWRTISGGAHEYVRRITANLQPRLRLNCPVTRVRRFPDYVELESRCGVERFDHVVIATHSDQALRLLADPSPLERDVLAAIRYQANDTALHTDVALLPRLRRTWSSWNYRIPSSPQNSVHVSYYMNMLQGLKTERPYIVTLNQIESIHPERMLQRIAYEHPVFTHAAVAAQRSWGELSGVRRTHYCGAYWGYGFHEDGVRSGVAVAQYFGKSL